MAERGGHVGLFVDTCVRKLSDVTKKPENFLSEQPKKATELRELIKDLYDHLKTFERELGGSDWKTPDALPELVVNNFDEEQIWQELELQNDDCHSELLNRVSQILARQVRLCFDNRNVDSEGGDSDGEVNGESENHENGLSDNNSVSEDGNDSDNFGLDVEENKHGGRPKKRMFYRSIVDDKFFKLCDMEEFLQDEDVKVSSGNQDEKEHYELFDNSSDEEADDDGDNDEKKSVYYRDFFDAPEDENVVEEDGEYGEEETMDERGQKREKRVRFADNEGEESEVEDEALQNINAQDYKSSFEERQERLQRRIAAMEEVAVAEKPWQLKGEVTATTRPMNSLLEEDLQFDHSFRPAPVITEETTLRLEDLIKQRIKDAAWDDVERKVKPVETPAEYKKRLVLNQEKSKVSLAQIYEQEYLDKQKKGDKNSNEREEEEEIPPEQKEITKMIDSLFTKLEALSNYHYTPKMAAPEIKVISNQPSITMEEVAPNAVSDAALLAPEEVKRKMRGELKGEDERNKTDKKRARRLKKKNQHIRQVEREKNQKLVEKLKPGLGNKYAKESALKQLQRASNDKAVKKAENTFGKASVKSSTTFFRHLQDEVITGVRETASRLKRQKEEKSKVSAKKLKL